MIDCHVHVLDPARFPYPETTHGYRPRDDETGTLDDLNAASGALGVTAHVVVAASVYGADNRSLVTTAQASAGRIKAVAAVDPADLGAVARLADLGCIAGIRLNLVDDRRLDDAAHARAALAAIRDAGLVACVQAAPARLAALVEGLDGLRLVLDHMGRPDLDGGVLALTDLAARPQTWLKLSGGFRMASLGWPRPGDDLRVLAQAFAPARHLWGSDWPFINLPGLVKPGYAQTLSWAFALSEADFEANARALFWGTA